MALSTDKADTVAKSLKVNMTTDLAIVFANGGNYE